MVEAAQRWFEELIDAAMEADVLVPARVIAHVTPELMADHLPPELVGELLANSLATGAMDAERVVAVLGPEILVAYIPHVVLWECLCEAGEAAGLTTPSAGGREAPIALGRRFLERAIDSGLTCEQISEEEIIAHLGPDLLARHLPKGLRARLLSACLDSSRVDAALFVHTVGIDGLARHCPAHLLWRVVAAGARRGAGIETERQLTATVTSDPDATVDVAALPDDRERKPNRRVSGAGATSRRRSIGVDEAARAAFALGEDFAGAAHRATTEPAISEIEVLDETDVVDRQD